MHIYVRDLEEVLIRTMADFGIEAFRIEGLTGVHTREGKIAAIGIHHQTLGDDARFRAQCKHGFEFFRLDYRLRRRAGYFDGKTFGTRN